MLDDESHSNEVTDTEGNKLSNLAFLDLSDEERDSLQARYRALH